MNTTDILVIGGGIAGLSFVSKAAKWFPHLQITVVTKDNGMESNTRYAQGGIAIALDTDTDSFAKHIEDTMLAGAGLCDPEVVKKVVTEGPARLTELIEWGVQFDRDATGKLALGREGGHTAHRIIHYKDATGFQIAQGLLHHIGMMPNVTLLDHHFAVDLVTNSNGGETECNGAVLIDIKQGVMRLIASRVTILATGGAGQIYANTTNPVIATGDGIAMAFRAGATVKDMEFVQFHPTAFYSKTENPSFLISEAVRGYGAYLRSRDGARFVLEYDKRGELASRDIVSKAIHHEISIRGEEAVFLDCRHLPADRLKEHFPTIYKQCLMRGIDITCDVVPVAPAAHYICGGVAVDVHGRTSITNLYACGECSCTGLHGGNRLASNSLLEALVYAHAIFLDIERRLEQISRSEALNFFGSCRAGGTDDAWIGSQRQAIRELMSRNAGIVRNYETLRQTLEFLNGASTRIDEYRHHHETDTAWWELRNIVDVATLIVTHSIGRKENRGTYHNSDLITS